MRLPSARWLIGLAAAGLLVVVSSAGATNAKADQAAHPSSSCDLRSQDGRIKHAVNIVFDNTHFSRDNPNVPSDLEQMPNLLGFITGNGTLLSQQHTPLIAHTGTDILTGFTGQYGDQMGMPVSNSFGFYDTNQSASFRSTFQYWTARLGGKNDNTYYMTTPDGKNAPAPWVPYTRAGCNVGAVASANIVLENTQFDIPTVFGKGSPEDQQAQANKVKAQADYVGIAVHCGQNAAGCADSSGARPDVLPDEPGGYQGYQGLFGAKYTNPAIGGTVKDLNGNVIADSAGNPGFPGFDAMSASASLGYVAAMQEHGTPVTYAYISDAHDNHAAGRAFGPGEAGYVAQLKAYDDAFGKFFQRLAKDGITKDNTLFTFTADEGDHFVGGPPSPAGCDGVNVPCTYPKIGELNANLSGLLSAVPPYSTGTPVPAMSVHADSAPTVYLNGNPSQTDPVTRTAERASNTITAVNPMTNQTDRVTNYLAGTAQMRNLHMLTGDASRNPTYTLFGNPDYYLCATGFSCSMKGTEVVQNPAFAWNHGTVSPDINVTWLGMVGPGVRNLGVDGSTWSDHADIRPTIMALLGLKDDYRHQGRVLAETLDPNALPEGFGNVESYIRLGQLYKQINAPLGAFGLATLKISTAALASGSNQDDSVYAATTQRLTELGAARDQIAAQMANVLDRTTSSVGDGNDQQGHADAGGLQGRAADLIQTAGQEGGE